MPTVNTRRVFGHAAASLEGVRRSLNVPRPASLRHIADLYVRDVVFDEPIVTSGGVALSGHHSLTVRRDGSHRYRGSFGATGLPSFDVAILTTLGYPIPVPDSPSPAGGLVAFTAHGRVHGTNEPGDRVYRWDKSGTSPLLATEWFGVRQSRLDHQLEYDADWFGPVGDVVSFLAQVVVLGATFGSAGVALVIAGEAAELLNLEQLVLPGTVGLILASGAVFVFGPGVLFPAFTVGAIATAALIKQRHLESDEIPFVDRVFRGKLPVDRVLLTNLVGLGGRPFTAPGPGGVILVNLGLGYDDPMRYSGKGGTQVGVNAPGQLLIHELTHAWQIGNESFTPEYYCRAVSTAAGTTGGNMSAYSYGPAVGDWGSFGTEQQASIVEDWFAGSTNPDTRSPQITYPPMHEDDQTPNRNPYYRYIRDNIRTGVAG
jgi:hypothetical protein